MNGYTRDRDKDVMVRHGGYAFIRSDLHPVRSAAQAPRAAKRLFDIKAVDACCSDHGLGLNSIHC